VIDLGGSADIAELKARHAQGLGGQSAMSDALQFAAADALGHRLRQVVLVGIRIIFRNRINGLHWTRLFAQSARRSIHGEGRALAKLQRREW
jgi:hypothetical protein